jgi:hypothetical protein
MGEAAALRARSGLAAPLKHGYADRVSNRRIEMPKNRHPVDELADVREAIAKLKDREQELRRAILGGSCTRNGDEWIADVRKQSRSTLRKEDVIAHFGEAAVKPLMRKTTSEALFLLPLSKKPAS